MLRVALKGLLGHKLRFALTAIAVVLGVTFVSGTFVLTDSINAAFGDLFGEITASADLFVEPVRNVERGPAGGPAEQPPIPEAVAEAVAGVEGVAAVGGSVQGFAQIIGPDGEAIANSGAPTFGFNWTEVGNPLVLREGHPPGSGEIVMDAGTFDQAGFAVGDAVEVLTVTGRASYLLVGTATFGDVDNMLGATFIGFDTATAQQAMDRPGEYNALALEVVDGASILDVRQAVQEVIGEDFEAKTAEETASDNQEQVASFLGFLNTALLAFAGVALFVGTFIITNTFSIVVAQRNREFALLRAVGASSRQVRTAVLAEALVVGLVSGVVGLVLGVAFASFLQSVMAAVGLDLPAGSTTVQPRTVVAAMLVGVGVTLVASLLPARRASRVAPVEAMRDGMVEHEEQLGRRSVVGAGLMAAGGVLIVVALAGVLPSPPAWVGLGAVVLMIGVSLAAPLAAGPVARVVGALPARRSTSGRLAQRNAVRDRRRTATTASALMIGLALVAFVAIFAASIRGSVARSLNEQFRADYIVSTDTPVLRNLPPTFAQELAEAPEFAAVSPIRVAAFKYNESTSVLAAVDPGTITEVVSLGEVTGDLGSLAAGQVFLRTTTAEDNDLAIGDVVEVILPLAGATSLEVAGTFTEADLIGANWLFPLQGYGETISDPLDAYVYAKAAAGVDAVRSREVIERIAAEVPGAQVQDQAEFREEQDQQINQLLTLVTALLLLAIVVAVLGITNTLALSVFERTREIGLLRAVGMDRPQARRMITWESVIVAVFGAVLGIAVGTFLGWAIVRALEDQGINRLVLPGGQLLAGLVGAAVAGVIAAIYPARRAARLDVLQAVTTE